MPLIEVSMDNLLSVADLALVAQKATLKTPYKTIQRSHIIEIHSVIKVA
jgi:hypothetical protein